MPESQQESLFDLYFQRVEQTEPPIIFHRWSLIASISALLGRHVWFPFGEGRIFPNMYVMLIGESGTRKSTAIIKASKTIAEAGYETFAAKRTSKEQFLIDLEGLPDENSTPMPGRKPRKIESSPVDVLANLNIGTVDLGNDGLPKEVFITADEFNNFAGVSNGEFLSILGELWDWDSEDRTYTQRFKSRSVSIYQPTITILGGNTDAGFKLAFPEYMVSQGFLSRLLLVHSEPNTRKITFPGEASPEIRTRVLERILEIKQLRGPFSYDAEAKRIFDTLYRTWQPLEDTRLKSYGSRRLVHLIKLTMVCAAMRNTLAINGKDVILANTILTYTESSMSKALGEFGKNRDSDATHAIMKALYEAAAANPPTLLNVEMIFKKVQRDISGGIVRLNDLLIDLARAGKIEPVKEKPGYFIAITRKVSNNDYINLNLLKEVTG